MNTGSTMARSISAVACVLVMAFTASQMEAGPIYPVNANAGAVYHIDGLEVARRDGTFQNGVASWPGGAPIVWDCFFPSDPFHGACGGALAVSPGHMAVGASLSHHGPRSHHEHIGVQANYRDVLSLTSPLSPELELCTGNECLMFFQYHLTGIARWDDVTTPISNTPLLSVSFGTHTPDADQPGAPGQDGVIGMQTYYPLNWIGFDVTGRVLAASFRANEDFNIYPFLVVDLALPPGDPAFEPHYINWLQADFGHTLRVTGIDIESSNGTPITQFQFTGASGAVYGPQGIQVVPEPATGLLLGLGLLTIGRVARRQRSQA